MIFVYSYGRFFLLSGLDNTVIIITIAIIAQIIYYYCNINISVLIDFCTLFCFRALWKWSHVRPYERPVLNSTATPCPDFNARWWVTPETHLHVRAEWLMVHNVLLSRDATGKIKINNNTAQGKEGPCFCFKLLTFNSPSVNNKDVELSLKFNLNF